MTAAVFRFTLAQLFRSASVYVNFFLFGGVSCFLLMGAANAFTGKVNVSVGGNVLVNSPYGIAGLTGLMTIVGIFPIATLAGRAAVMDFHANIHAFFFTTPVGKFSYLAGRLLAALTVTLLVLTSIALGLFVGTHMPGVDRVMLGPNHFRDYAWPYVTLVIPDVFIAGVIYFCIGAIARRTFAVWMGLTVFLAGYVAASALQVHIENHLVSSLLDPMGLIATTHVTQYWTASERSSKLVPLAGDLLWNRATWLAIATAVLAFTSRRFRFEALQRETPHFPDRVREQSVLAPSPARAGRDPVPRLAAFARLLWWDFRDVVANRYFAILMLAGCAFLASGFKTMGSLWGTPTWPVTWQIAELLNKYFALVCIAIAIFYAGQIVWRERDAGIDEIADVLPVSEWMRLLAKLGALVAVQASIIGFLAIVGMAFQLARGYTHLQPGLFLELLGLDLIGYSLLCVLAVAAHAIAGGKAAGHLCMFLWIVLESIQGIAGHQEHIYSFASDPDITYSDMNGFGPFLKATFWYNLYWTAFAVLLALAAYLFWVRGLATDWRWRWRHARVRFGRGEKCLAAAAGALFLGVCAFIVLNTRFLNTYRSASQETKLHVQYEKEFLPYKKMPQPRITAVNVRVELYPERRAMRIQGKYDIVNRADAPIQRIFVGVTEAMHVRRLEFHPPAKNRRADPVLDTFLYDLEKPLAPGAAGTLEFDLEFTPRGFTNSGGPTHPVAGNGTFFNSGMFPHFGFDDANQLADADVRRKYGLKPLPRMAEADDREARGRPDFPRDADWVTFNGIIGTSADQIALAPGELLREWSEGGRRYFQYRTLGKVRCFFPVLSARYQVMRGSWQDVGLGIYYHRGHEYNLARMMQGLKESLDYCTRNFGPYQNKTLRIAEFPRYATFAQSFPATIPYSESIGFIARVDPSDPDDVDYPFYVTAHEVAHQWWAHQVAAADVKGASMLSESLAQYTALMVMKQHYGVERMQRFLKYETDLYLKGRAADRSGEPTLIEVEHEQYVYYHRASLAFYALQDTIGEETVNRVLRDYVRKVAWQSPPYTSAPELIGMLRAATPPDHPNLISDLFEHITLYDNKIIFDACKPAAGKGYEVAMKLQLRKMQADENGEETQVGMADAVDVGLFDKQGRLMKRSVVQAEHSMVDVTLTTAERPAKAVLDPWYKLIDRNREDNARAVCK